MQIKYLVSMGGARSIAPGDVETVADAEAKRLIAAGFAVAHGPTVAQPGRVPARRGSKVERAVADKSGVETAAAKPEGSAE